VTDPDSKPSALPASQSDPSVYKAILAIGVMGSQEDVARFTALWITDAERRAQQIAAKLFHGRVQLLPLPESDELGRHN
jgi:hypothetical protein